MSLKNIENSGKQDSPIMAGVKDELAVNSIQIYPNPADNDLFINSEGIMSLDNIMIYDMLGNQILALPINSYAPTPINITQYQAGAYIVRFYSEDKLIETKMFVKR